MHVGRKQKTPAKVLPDVSSDLVGSAGIKRGKIGSSRRSDHVPQQTRTGEVLADLYRGSLVEMGKVELGSGLMVERTGFVLVKRGDLISLVT